MKLYINQNKKGGNEMFNIEEQLKMLPDKPGVYIMHDEKDDIVSVEMAYSLQEALPSFNKQILILPDCSHGEGIIRQPFKVKSLLEKNLKKYEL